MIPEGLAKKYAKEIMQARELGNGFPPDYKGRFPWHLSERSGKRLNLSKASLGEFCFEVLSHGGNVYDFFVMWPDTHKSAVWACVHLTISAKYAVEAKTGFKLEAPPVVRVN